MGTFTSAATGNWTSETTWGTSAGQGEGVTYPGPNDDVIIATGHVVTLNTLTRVPSTGTLTSLTAQGSGKMDVPLNTLGATSFYCTTITSGTSNYALASTGSSSATLTVYTDTVQAGAGAIGISAAGTNNTVKLLGNTGSTISITGGGASGGVGVYSNGSSTTVQCGDSTNTATVTGGSNDGGYGARVSGGSTVTIYGNAYGGAGSSNGCPGVYGSSGSSTINILNGTLKGTTTAGRFQGTGVQLVATSGTVNITNCIIDNTQGAMAYYGAVPLLSPSATNYVKYNKIGGGTEEFPLAPLVTNVKKDVAYGTQTGTLATGYGVMP